MELMEEAKLLLKVAQEKMIEEKKVLLSSITADSEDVYEIYKKFTKLNKSIASIESTICDDDLKKLYHSDIINSIINKSTCAKNKYLEKLDEVLSNKSEVAFVYSGCFCEIEAGDDCSYSISIMLKNHLLIEGKNILTIDIDIDSASAIHYCIHKVETAIKNAEYEPVLDDANKLSIIENAKILKKDGSVTFTYNNLVFNVRMDDNISFKIEYGLLDSINVDTITIIGDPLDAIVNCYNIADHF